MRSSPTSTTGPCGRSTRPVASSATALPRGVAVHLGFCFTGVGIHRLAVGARQRSSGALPSTSTGAASASSGGPAYAQALLPDLEQLVRDMAVTGAVVLVRSSEHGSWTTTIGTRTWHGTEPVMLADHVRVGSNTKTWTGTVILQLVDEGRIGLDDPVSMYRPDVP